MNIYESKRRWGYSIGKPERKAAGKGKITVVFYTKGFQWEALLRFNGERVAKAKYYEIAKGKAKGEIDLEYAITQTGMSNNDFIKARKEAEEAYIDSL